MRSVEEIKRDIDSLDNQMIISCYQVGQGEKTIELRKQRETLENELCLANSTLVVSSDEFDIYEQRKYKENFAYYIAFHNTYSIVGFITADYGNSNHVNGNVGYEIYRRFRGHGYARKALELLLDVFIDRGMDISIIVIEPWNVASIKTTEAFGGILVKKASSEYGTNVYNVDLKEKVLNKQK